MKPGFRELGMGAVLAATLRRELQIALRSPGNMVNPLMFFIIAVALFPLGGSADPEWLARIAPGVVWVTALLAVMLSMESLFRSDFEDGTLELLLLSPQPLYFHLQIKVLAHWLVTGLPLVLIAPLLAYMLALPAEGYAPLLLGLLLLSPQPLYFHLQIKVLAHWLVTGLPLVLIAPLLAYMLALPAEGYAPLLLGLLLGTPTLNLIGAIGTALTVGLARNGVLLAVLVLPLFIPVLVFGAGMVQTALNGLPVAGIAAVMGALLMLALSLAPLAMAAALRISVN